MSPVAGRPESWLSTPRLDVALAPKDQRVYLSAKDEVIAGWLGPAKPILRHLRLTRPRQAGVGLRDEQLIRHTLRSLEHPVRSSRASPASSQHVDSLEKPLLDCVARASTRAAAEKAPLVSQCSRLNISSIRRSFCFELPACAFCSCRQKPSPSRERPTVNPTGVGSPLPAPQPRLVPR